MGSLVLDSPPSPPSQWHCLKQEPWKDGDYVKPFALQAENQALHTTTLCWMEPDLPGRLGLLPILLCPMPHVKAALIWCWGELWS